MYENFTLYKKSKSAFLRAISLYLKIYVAKKFASKFMNFVNILFMLKSFLFISKFISSHKIFISLNLLYRN